MRILHVLGPLLTTLLPLLPTPTHARLSFQDIHNANRLTRLSTSFTTAAQKLESLRTSRTQTSNTILDESVQLLLDSTSEEEEWTPPTLHNVTVQLPINHFGPSPAPYTFPNRLFVVDAYYRPGGPVFVFDTGETENAYDYAAYLTSNLSFFNAYLREFGGLGVLWEHRYYGESLPYRIDLETSSEEMRWLTTEQALMDFKVFAGGFRWRIGGGMGSVGGGFGSKVPGESLLGQVVDFDPKGTPWVVVGGSYPGMRAAMLRERFPETVYAAYASSAPIQASENMTFYWDQVHRGMAEYGLANCTAHIFAALEYIDAQLALSPESAAAIKSRFLGRTGENTTHGAFADALLYPLYGWQSLGAGDPVLQEFCQVLETGEGGRDHRAPTAQVLADRWARWGLFAALVNAYNPGSYCEGFVTNNARTPSCRLGERFTSPAGIAWTWQYCTEWGFFQGTNLGPHALGSRFNTLAHQQALCYAQFPDGLASGHLPRSPRTEYVNALYGGWRMRPSNTFWTSGEWDPWRSLTPLSAEAFALGTPVTGEVPACGVRPRERLFGYTLENSEHCYDFDPAVNNPRAGVPQRMFARALHVWLGCFGVEPAEA